VAECEQQTMGTEKAAKGKHLTLTAFMALLHHLHIAGRAQILHSATKTLHVLWSMVDTYTHPVCCPLPPITKNCILHKEMRGLAASQLVTRQSLNLVLLYRLWARGRDRSGPGATLL